MELTLIGLSHRTAPIELRERVAFDEDQARAAVPKLKERTGAGEVLVLSTCNRTEIVLASQNDPPVFHEVVDFLCEERGVTGEELGESLYRYRSADVVRHLFRVASSLDSLVVGEPQILGQVKEAYQTANKAGGCGPILNRLMHRTFQVAKRVRTETQIAENAVSVSYAGVELGRRIFGTLTGRSALLLGAGEMAELAVKHLLASGLGKLTIANRTRERATALASQFGGYAVGWDDVDKALEEVDIVIASAAVPHHVIRRERLEHVMRERKYRPLFFIDLGVPRNVDPAVSSLEGAYVYDIDDLESVVEENKKGRHEEARKAEEIVTAEVDSFLEYLNSLQVVPTIIAVKARIEEIRKNEVEKILGQLEGISEQHRERIDYLTRAITNKILHTPITALKEAERTGTADQVTHAAKKLFGLETELHAALEAELKDVSESGE